MRQLYNMSPRRSPRSSKAVCGCRAGCNKQQHGRWRAHVLVCLDRAVWCLSYAMSPCEAVLSQSFVCSAAAQLVMLL